MTYDYIYETLIEEGEVKRELHRLYYEVYSDEDLTLVNQNYEFIDNLPIELITTRMNHYGLQIYLMELVSVVESYNSINIGSGRSGPLNSDSIKYRDLISSTAYESMTNSLEVPKSIQDSLIALKLPVSNLNLIHEGVRSNPFSYPFEYNTSPPQSFFEGRYGISPNSFESPPLRPIGFADLTEESINKYSDNLRNSNRYINALINSLRAYRRNSEFTSEADILIEKLLPLSEVLFSNLQLVEKMSLTIERMNSKIDHSINYVTTDVVTDFSSGMTSHSIGEFKTRAEWYVSGDLGVAYVDFGSNFSPESTLQPYFGVNFNFAPVNRQRHFNLFKSIAKGDFFRRPLRNFSGIIGVSLEGIKNLNDDERLSPLWGNINLLTGIGIRIYDPVRVNVGYVWVKEEDVNPIVDKTSLRMFPFASLSFDIDVKERLSKFGNIFK